MFLVAALIPMIVGMLYYHKKTVGGPWMKVNGFTEEGLQEGANMGLILGLSYVFSIMLAFILSSFVIHQGGVFSMLYPGILEAGSTEQILFNDLMSKYGDSGRSFGHGAIHGIMVSVFAVLPIIGINALFERRGFKYIFIHFGYWLITLVLMGGLLCSTLQYSPL